MNRSKVDRIQDLFRDRLRRAIDSVRLELHVQGKHDAAGLMAQYEQALCVRMGSMGQYERLELSDIIKGHKRAWPET